MLATGALGDDGDLHLDNVSPTEESRTAIEQGVHKILMRGDRPLSLGGDHSVTHSIMCAIARAVPDVTILQFDAHPDLYDNFEGDKHSHACPFARILEEGLAGRLVQVGIRTATRHQREQARRFGVDVIEMRDWSRGKRPSVTAPLYVSVDMDAFDPAFAPGVSHREPGGLSVRDVVDIVQSLPGPIVGADVVEYNPSQDSGDITAFVAAKIVKELASRMMEAQERSI